MAQLGSLHAAAKTATREALQLPEDAQGCTHFLATDHFVNADGRLPSHLSRGMDLCFNAVMSNRSLSYKWWWLTKDAIEDAVARRPAMAHALEHDPEGLRALIEVGMLTKASACVERSHIVTSTVDVLRSNLGKAKCYRASERWP